MGKHKILFHVGLHKCGSTSLQREFFCWKNKFLQYPKGKSNWLPIFVNKFSTELLSNEDQQLICDFADHAYSSGLMPVISHERLSGYPISGGYDRLSIYNRIKSLDLDVKILLVVREQEEWLYSAWRQMITDGSQISLIKFLQQKPTIHKVRIPNVRFEYLNYELEIQNLYDLFGSKNVLVYPFEAMIHQFSDFKKSIGRLMNISYGDSQVELEHLPIYNSRQTLSSFYVKLFMNRYLISSATSPCGLISDQTKLGSRIRFLISKGASFLPEVPLSTQIVEHHKEIIANNVGDYFKESNRAAAAMININLGQFGYRM